MNEGKLEMVKQEMTRVNVDILGISEVKWTGMGEFNSDDHYLLLWARILLGASMRNSTHGKGHEDLFVQFCVFLPPLLMKCVHWRSEWQTTSVFLP